MDEGLRSVIGFWLAFVVLMLVVAWSSTATCDTCGNECVNQYSCLSGCVCAYPEGDDHHWRGRCVKGGGY